MNEDEVEVTRVVIMGAFGRDFHDFITVFRDDPSYRVVAFTQHGGQNLGETRDGGHDVFPAELAGPHHDADIPIEPESDLERVVDEYDADEVVFSYSDVSHEDVMHQASRAMASGANFRLLGPEDIEVEVDAPVLAVDAVRTGCGKSQLSRALAEELHDRGLEAVVVREPMPYAEDLAANAVQRFETFDDLDAADVTIEEREEYEQHIERGHVVYAGVDYPEIFERAAAEGDVVVWDGGNNELPFADPDLHFVLADPLRADDTDTSHPGETNLRRADAVVVNKENSASREQVTEVVARVHEANRDADVYHADSVVTVEDPEAIEGETSSWSRTARRSPTATPTTARGPSPRASTTLPNSSTRGTPPSGRSPTCSRTTRTSSTSCRRWATATNRSGNSNRPSRGRPGRRRRGDPTRPR
ncbi:GTPase [Halospeciosus flavus]|uniref:GTPase n=1 Tax=Halospeciosus flavus TaxID=3032283 RepID=UPI003607D908